MIVKKLVVFDLDGVLLTSNFEKEKEHLFLSLNDCCRIQSGIILFEKVKELIELSNNSIDSCILTTRHPILSLEIYHEFKIPVFTRDFCYTKEEMIEANRTPENTKIFLQKMTDFKTRYLNFFAERYDRVIFIDDMAKLFDVTKFSRNISIFLPDQSEKIMRKLRS